MLYIFLQTQAELTVKYIDNNSDQLFASVGRSGVECRKKGTTPGVKTPAMAEYWQQNPTNQENQHQPQQQEQLMLSNGAGGSSVARDESAAACNGVGRGGSVGSANASAMGNNNNNYVNFNQFITQHNLTTSNLGFSYGGGGGGGGGSGLRLTPNSSSSRNTFGVSASLAIRSRVTL